MFFMKWGFLESKKRFQGVHILYESETVKVLFAHLSLQNIFSRKLTFLESKKRFRRTAIRFLFIANSLSNHLHGHESGDFVCLQACQLQFYICSLVIIMPS